MKRTGLAESFRLEAEASGRRALKGALRPVGRSRWRVRTAVIAVLAIAAVGAVAEPAYATSYPSWQDVQNAKASAAAAAAQVATINGLIAQLQTEVAQTQAEAEQRGVELQVAQDNFDEADFRANNLQAQADASKVKADAATAQAGRLAAQLYRSGGSNLTANIFLSGSSNTANTGADELLSSLGSMTKLVEQSSEIYKQAATAQNTARALSAQADVARIEREKLRAAADEALKVAAAAAAAAQAKLAEQQSQIVIMQAQLAALQDSASQTVSAYEAGVAERARAAAARGGGGLPGGFVGPQGWAVPVRGVITAGFGPRVAPCADCSSYHKGIDLGAACGSTIYAAHAGTVMYAGPNGSYGNFVLLDNGGGIDTGYAHIRPGGIFVGIGQSVGAGEPIASVGDTGASTGCHLHFEVRVGGSPIDGIPFMRQRGAPLG
jgi:murein DD-endopeptidase MepM/ murein hydrolase activator NlpD